VAWSGGPAGKVRQGRGVRGRCRASGASVAVRRPRGAPARRDRRRDHDRGRSYAPTAHCAHSSRSATATARCPAARCQSNRRGSPRCPGVHGRRKQARPRDPDRKNTAGHGGHPGTGGTRRVTSTDRLPRPAHMRFLVLALTSDPYRYICVVRTPDFTQLGPIP